MITDIAAAIAASPASGIPARGEELCHAGVRLVRPSVHLGTSSL